MVSSRWSILAAHAPWCDRLAQSTSRRCYQEVSYFKHGEPKSVLQHWQSDPARVLDQDLQKLKERPNGFPAHEQWVRVEYLYASINPADLNTIQGKYPSPIASAENDEFGWLLASAPKFLLSQHHDSAPTIAGSEGIGRVTHVAGCSGGSTLKEGDLVIPSLPSTGTWRSSLVAPSSFFSRLFLADHPEEQLASLSTVPQIAGTAYRMLADFVDLNQQRVVLQNGGASAVGAMVSQLAPALYHDCKVVSVVRRGERSKEAFVGLADRLVTTGRASLVVEEDELLSDQKALREFQAHLASLDPQGRLPQLALNCVGGDSASLLARCLRPGGTLVTYGGLSMLPITMSTSQLIFKDIRSVGYWHSRWIAATFARHGNGPRDAMLTRIFDCVRRGQVTPTQVQQFSMEHIYEALRHHIATPAGCSLRRKAVIRCRPG